MLSTLLSLNPNHSAAPATRQNINAVLAKTGTSGEQAAIYSVIYYILLFCHVLEENMGSNQGLMA